MNRLRKNAVILTRVSKESQSYERQIKDLRTYAKNNNLEVLREFNEKVSGATKNDKREALVGLNEFIAVNEVNTILVWELSRLGRSTLEVLKSLESFHEKGVSLYIHNYNLNTLNPDGSVNSLTQLLITMLAEFARTEREAIKQRLQSGYRKHLENHGSVGRKQGYRMSKDQLLERHQDIVKYRVKRGMSIREISKITGKSTRTVQKVIKAYNE